MSHDLDTLLLMATVVAVTIVATVGIHAMQSCASKKPDLGRVGLCCGMRVGGSPGQPCFFQGDFACLTRWKQLGFLAQAFRFFCEACSEGLGGLDAFDHDQPRGDAETLPQGEPLRRQPRADVAGASCRVWKGSGQRHIKLPRDRIRRRHCIP